MSKRSQRHQPAVDIDESLAGLMQDVEQFLGTEPGEAETAAKATAPPLTEGERRVLEEARGEVECWLISSVGSGERAQEGER